MFQVSQVFQTHAENYNSTIIDILRKYKSDFTQSDIENITLLLSENYSNTILKQKLETLLSSEILESDIQTLKQSYLTFIDERDVQIERLHFKQDEQTMMLITQRDKAIETILEDIISSRQDWSEQEIKNIILEVISYFYQNNTLSETESFTDIIETISETYNVEVTTQEIQNTSYDFDELSFLDFMQQLTQNYETSLSYNELIEYYNSYTTHQLLLENIITETSLIESETPLIEYETIITENTAQIESLYETHEIFTTLTQEEIQSYFISELDYSDVEVLHQQRIQESWELPDAITQSLKQEYKDDSAMLENLTPIAYVQELSGNNALITNLAGGSKLAQENALLYAGYTVETFSDSQLVLVFSDESLLRLEDNSKVTLTQSNNSSLWVDVEHWNIWSRVIKPLFTQDSFEISSESVSLAVRGTSVYIQKQQNSDFSAYVVDSYTAKGTNSLELVDSATGENLSLGKGEVFTKENTETRGQKNTFTRQSLMQQDAQIWEFLRDDLQYLSLTLDDRNRGFYNNPISSKNDSKNFIDKLSGELESSLPSNQESDTFFINAQTPKDNITPDTIYLRIMQDKLISDIKNSPENNNAAKISAIAALDIETLKRNIWNLREIENRLDLNISQEIITRPSLTSQDINDIFLDFGLEEQQALKSKLIRVRNHLKNTINDWSAYLSADIVLPTEYEGVNINWISSNSEYLEDFGKILKYSDQEDIILSLTALLSIEDQELEHVFPLIIKKREPTDEQKLEKSMRVLEEHISNIGTFTNTIDLPDFNQEWAIIPKIVWKQDDYVNSNGTLNRPSFVQWDIIYHPAIATLSFWEARLEEKEFTLKRIKKRAEIPEEIQVEFNVSSAESQFPGCDIHDIQLSNGQVWSMCNVGSSKSGLSSESYGWYYEYRGGDAIEACQVDGYTLPSKSDFETLLAYFWNNVDDIQLALQLPKAWEKYKEHLVDSRKNIWIGTEIFYWSLTYDSVTDDEKYYTLEDNWINSEFRRSKLPVRCIRGDTVAEVEEEIEIEELVEPVDEIVVEPVITEPVITEPVITEPVITEPVITEPSLEEIAKQLLIDEKNRLLPYFENPIVIENDVLNIKDTLSGLNPNIKYAWAGAPKYVGTHGSISSPSYNDWDKDKTLTLTLSHDDTQETESVTWILVVVERQACNTTSPNIEKIGDVCYELVASAEYNEAWGYNLKLGWSTLVTADVWSGVNNNSYNLQSYYWWKIEELSRKKSFVKFWGEKWILLENYNWPGWWPEYLSYDLSSLNLWDDWAIEMSVRGEDLLDNSELKILTHVPWVFYIWVKNTWWPTLRKIYIVNKENTHSEILNSYIISDNYNNIIVNKIWSDLTLDINGNKVIKNNYFSNVDSITDFYLWSHSNKQYQWNWIINYTNIYKK